jgi:hypothetical protein
MDLITHKTFIHSHFFQVVAAVQPHVPNSPTTKAPEGTAEVASDRDDVIEYSVQTKHRLHQPENQRVLKPAKSAKGVYMQTIMLPSFSLDFKTDQTFFAAK